jgi:hypothetical protein
LAQEERCCLAISLAYPSGEEGGNLLVHMFLPAVNGLRGGRGGTLCVLSTVASLYSLNSLLLISYKFWMGGEGGELVGEKRGGRVGGVE